MKFLLINGETDRVYGRISFNGKFVFDLNEDIDIEYWNKIGFIKLENGVRHIESQDLFRHLNSRLPITLRGEPNERKLEYIQSSGLRVASDSFFLEQTEA